jgi:hypothetical protein
MRASGYLYHSAPRERCALVDFPEVGLGQQLDEKLYRAGVHQFRFGLSVAVPTGRGLLLFVPEGISELSTHALSPPVHGLWAGTETGSRSTGSLVARESLTFWACGPFIQGIVSIMVAGGAVP